MIEVPRCLPRLSVERLKSMNPLIRLCGLKRRHGEPICYTVQEIRNVTSTCDPRRMVVDSCKAIRVSCLYHSMGHDLLPTCGMQGQRVRWAANPTRSSPDRQTGEGRYRMPRGHGPDDVSTDGALVVVRGGESLPHGEGEQFKHACKAHYPTKRGEDL